MSIIIGKLTGQYVKCEFRLTFINKSETDEHELKGGKY